MPSRGPDIVWVVRSGDRAGGGKRETSSGHENLRHACTCSSSDLGNAEMVGCMRYCTSSICTGWSLASSLWNRLRSYWDSFPPYAT